MRIPAVALFLAIAGPASAASIAPSEQGWIDFEGFHVGGSINTFTGRTGNFASCDPARPPLNCVESTRSFYVFPLPAGAAFGAAHLVIELERYFSDDPEEPFTLYSFEGDPAALGVDRPRGDPVGIALFDDLGSGDVYGRATAAPAFVGTQLVIPLSPEALARINDPLASTFVFGISADSVTDTLRFNEGFRFSNSVRVAPGFARLVLDPVPEPTVTVMLAAALLLRLKRRRGTIPTSRWKGLSLGGPVPEPSATALLALGLAALARSARCRSRSA